MNHSRILWEKIRIIIQVLRINLRTSLIVLIGLSISLSTITSSLIFLESNKSDFYLTILEDDRFNKVIYEHWTSSVQNFDKSELIELQESLSVVIKERGIEQVLVKDPFYPVCYARRGMTFLDPEKYDKFYGISLNESILENCVEGSRLPTNMNETILYNYGGIDIEIGDIFNITFYHYSAVTTNVSHPIQIVGIITPETLNETSPLFENYIFFQSYGEGTLISDLGLYLELIGKIENNFRVLVPTFRFDVHLQFRFNFRDASINQKNAIQQISNLVSFLKETKEDFYLNNIKLDIEWVSRVSNPISKVEEYNSLFLLFLIFCSPAFLLAILLVRFSLGLINDRRRRSLGLFKMRGLSPRFLLLLLFVETLVLAFIAVPVSIILGILGFLLISTSTGFLSFNFANIPNSLLFPPLLLPVTTIFSICLTSIPYIYPMQKLAKADLFYLKQEVSIKEKSTPRRLIGRFDLDLFLFFQGLSGLIILIILIQIINTSNLDIQESQLFNLFLPLIQLLLIVSPFSFLMGFILAYNRFIPFFFKKLGDITVKKDWRFLAISSKNLLIDIKATGRMSILLISTLSFLIILSSLPLSYYHHQIDSTYYNNGAEIVLQFPLKSSSFTEIQTQLNSIEGLSLTTISRAGIVIEDRRGLLHDIWFIGIEENFHRIAHWQEYYDDQSLSFLVQSLFNSSDPYPIILDSITAQEERVNVKGLYRPFKDETTGISFLVTGVSDYWPGIIDKRNPSHHYLITNRTLIENISSIAMNYYNISGSMTSGDRIWGKVLPGYDPDPITSQILSVTTNAGFDGSINFVKSQLESSSQRQMDRFLWLITNFDFIDSFIVAFIVILLFSLMRLSIQSTEIGLSRALGMKHKQVFLLLFLEPLILFFVSGFPGALIGLLFLLFSASVLSPLLIPAPPFILKYNMLVLIFIFSLIFSITVLTGLIASYRATRTNISEILNVE